MAGTLSLDRVGSVAVLTLNRPAVRNALDLAMRSELAQCVDAIRADEDLTALVLTGAGGNFCSGGDLSALRQRTPGVAAARARIRDTHGWVHGLLSLARPVFAAVDGAAFGGGFNMALAADRVIATPRARFCQVFGRIGMVPDLAGMALLPRSIGLANAKRLILCGAVLDAEECVRLGLVQRIVAPDDLLDATLQEAAEITPEHARAFGRLKAGLWANGFAMRG